MSEKIKTVQIGLGGRGTLQLQAFLDNRDRFEITGICDIDEKRVRDAAEKQGLPENCCFTDAEEMLQSVKPELMSFSTMPNVRLSMVELGIKYGVKGIMMEKPLANTVEEARKILELCREHHIKTVVCQQHKYLPSFRKLKEILDSGQIGDVYQISSSCQANASWMGTHYIDYMLWANGGRKVSAVAAHVHGSNFYGTDSHPAPAYVMGQMMMENGVRAFLECGYLSKPHMDHKGKGYPDRMRTLEYWVDDRMTVYGTKGYVWADPNGRWGVFSPETGGGILTGKEGSFMKNTSAMKEYTADMAAWMNGEIPEHPCDIEIAYHGFEALNAMYISAMENERVDLPLALPLKRNVAEQMAAELKQSDMKPFD